MPLGGTVDLSGSSALVVGGAGGLGEATTRRLAEAGVSVVIADLADDKGKTLEAELGDATRFVRTDVTSDDSVDAAIAAATELGPMRTAVVVHGGPAAARRIVGR